MDAVPWPHLGLYVACLIIQAGLALRLIRASWTTRVPAQSERRRRAIRWLALMLGAQCGWALGYLIELRAPTLSTKLLWDDLQWLALPPLAFGATAFAFQYTGIAARATRRFSTAALFSTAASVAGVLFHAVLGGGRASAHIDLSSGAPALTYDLGTLDIVASLVAASWVLVAAGCVLSAVSGQSSAHRVRTVLISVGLVLPWLVDLVVFGRVEVFGQRDLSPFTFAAGALLISVGIFQRRFDLLPVAHHTVLEVIPDGVLVLDNGNQIIEANAAARALSSGSELLGSDALAAFPGLRPMTDARSAGESFRFEYAGRSLVTRAVTLSDHDGQRLGAAIVMRDTTELEHLNADLERRVELRTAERAALSRRLEQAERLEALGRLAAGVAHDFNNLLTVMTSNVDLLAAGRSALPAGEDGELIDELRQAVSSATQLARQLLVFGRRPAVSSIPLDEELSHLIKMLTRLVGRGVELSFDLDAGSARVALDASGLSQIILNLLVNAQQAMDDRGVITVQSRRCTHEQPPSDAIGQSFMPGPYVTLHVRDVGPGIAPEILRHVFDPFFTTKPTGTGLGLSTVYSLAVQAGGMVAVRSRLGSGTCVEIHLPECTPLGRAEQLPAQTAPQERSVLLLDDREDVRCSVAKMLERLGYSVIRSETAEAALAELSGTAPIAVLLTDQAMPDASGTEVAERAIALRPSLHVLFMSAYPPVELVARWVALGRVRFISKPFSEQALAAALGSGAEQPAHRPDRQLAGAERFGGSIEDSGRE